MDPQATWLMLVEAINEKATLTAQEAVENLLAWANKGGGLPHTIPFTTHGLELLADLLEVWNG